MVSKSRKIFYIVLTSALTTTAVSAAYWQTNRYLQAKKRWRIIGQQLTLDNPPSLSQTQQTNLHPLKYISVEGVLSQQFMLISRARENRMGQLIVRPLCYKEKNNDEQKCILAVQGWIPEGYNFTPKEEKRQFKGILREKEKTDYLHTKMKETDIQKFNINTFIDVKKAIKTLQLQNKKLITQYYLEILKEEKGQQDVHHYPYQYSVDNFQLPYLTPDKHRAYALFWTMTSIVGFTAIYKTFRMK